MAITDDPLAGWDLEKVYHYAPSATNDIYGSLYFFLRDKFERFAQKVRRFPIRFLVSYVHANDLKAILQSHHLGITEFDRIEVRTFSHNLHFCTDDFNADFQSRGFPLRRTSQTTGVSW